jgi:hypothetical protein
MFVDIHIMCMHIRFKIIQYSACCALGVFVYTGVCVCVFVELRLQHCVISCEICPGNLQPVYGTVSTFLHIINIYVID